MNIINGEPNAQPNPHEDDFESYYEQECKNSKSRITNTVISPIPKHLKINDLPGQMSIVLLNNVAHVVSNGAVKTVEDRPVLRALLSNIERDLKTLSTAELKDLMHNCHIIKIKSKKLFEGVLARALNTPFDPSHEAQEFLNYTIAAIGEFSYKTEKTRLLFEKIAGEAISIHYSSSLWINFLKACYKLDFSAIRDKFLANIEPKLALIQKKQIQEHSKQYLKLIVLIVFLNHKTQAVKNFVNGYVNTLDLGKLKLSHCSALIWACAKLEIKHSTPAIQKQLAHFRKNFKTADASALTRIVFAWSFARMGIKDNKTTSLVKEECETVHTALVRTYDQLILKVAKAIHSKEPVSQDLAKLVSSYDSTLERSELLQQIKLNEAELIELEN